MKSVLKNLSLLTMGLMIYSCNEKISPELQSGNSTTIPNVTLPDEFYFKVTNNSPTVLNYKLHKTGSGNANVDCKISTSGLPLSNTLYTGDALTPHDSKSYDISCYLEAEEWSLYANGLSFNIEASKNTCEYVAYAPYSYYDAIPGASIASWRGVTCQDPASTLDAQALIPTLPTGMDVLGVGLPRQIGCDEMVDTSISVAANRLIVPIPTDNQPLCIFDYTDAGRGGGNGQNCDTGRMSFTFTNVYKNSTDPAPATFAAKPVSTPDHLCGGSIVSCVEGPIKQVDSLAETSRGSIAYGSALNEDYTKTYNLKALDDSARAGMHDLVNYRKGLASLDLNYMDYTSGNGINWGDPNYFKSFDPNLMEKYAANMNPDNTVVVDTTPNAETAAVPYATYDTYTRVLGWTGKPYAADPYLGLNGSRINPFYTFYCFDEALDVKARIRMVVRDWDRVFSTTLSDLELISDVYKNVSARRQDLPSSEEEVGNDPGMYNIYNDINDWDVQTPMTRTDPNLVGVYDPAFTFWYPTPSISYPAGFWDPSIFPSNGPAD